MGKLYKRKASGYPSRSFKKPRRMGPKVVPGSTRTAGFYRRYPQSSNELKFFDTDVNFTVDATAEVPSTGQFSLIPQGVTQSTRVGRKAMVKSIHLHGYCSVAPGAVGGSDPIVLYLMLDKQCNGAAATVTGDTGIFTSANVMQMNVNLANGDRFKILKRIELVMNAQAGVVGALAPSVKTFNWYGKCNIPIEFDPSASTGAITTIRSNNIFLVAGAAGQTDDTVTCLGTCRLRFSD